jgi:phage terminase large subunit-like protein
MQVVLKDRAPRPVVRPSHVKKTQVVDLRTTTWAREGFATDIGLKGTPFTIDHFTAWVHTLILDTGEPWVLEEFQREFISDVFTGFPECWLIVPEGNGKALALDTPIPTPTGWTDMESLRIGDEVFDDQGKACRVTFATGVMTGHDCYRVVFSDRTSLVADAGHLWWVWDEYRRGCLTQERLLTTQDLVEEHKYGADQNHRYSVPKSEPLDLPDAELPVDPYVLGAWLGDGTTASGEITFGEAFIREEIERIGYQVGQPSPSDDTPTCTVYGLTTMLKTLQVVGNKHIPEVYLRASRPQRLALLQGLMDTDGYCSLSQGQCEFVSIKQRLAVDALELVRSLGLKATLREGTAQFNGRDCGPEFRLQFHAYSDLPVFRMPRKYARQRHPLNRRSVSETRKIVDVIAVPSAPVRCVQVDSPSSLYLAGEGMVATHNTTLTAGFALYHAQYTPFAMVPIAASSADQAAILYQQAEGFCYRTEWMHSVFKPQPGYRRILCGRGSQIQVYAADEKTGDGVIPTLCIVDELHRHQNMRLYRTWRGKLDKRDGQLIAISTAGEPDSEFERIRDGIRSNTSVTDRGETFTRACSQSLIMHGWAVPQDGDIKNLDLVKRANPFSGVTREKLRVKRESPTSSELHFRRMNCNLPSRSEESAISEQEWASCRTSERIPEGQPIWLGLDVAWKWDTTALVPLWMKSPDFRLFDRVEVVETPRDGTSLNPRLVEDALLKIHARNPIHTVVMDETRAEQLGVWIAERLGAQVISRGQSAPYQVMDYERFMEGLRSHFIYHTGDPTLTTQVLNAITKPSTNLKVVFSRRSQSRWNNYQDSRVIDALVAAGMVHSVAVAQMSERVVELEPLFAVGA